MSFSSLNLHPNITKAITMCGYSTPTPVQAKTIPSILEGKDIVASAQTGTGKTAAFVLPALHRLASEPPTKKTRILILTPTRELANQVTKAAMQYGKFLQFNIVNLVGGMPYPQQIRELTRGANIIVATPGRLLDHMERGRVNLADVEILILDEADRMLDMGFIDDVEYIAGLIPNRQTLLFSATVGKGLTNVVRHLLKNPVHIDLSNEKLTVPQIEQQLYKAKSPHHKMQLLKHFLNDQPIFKAIIFSATKVNADKIADKLREDGFAAAALHGDLRQSARNRRLAEFVNGKIQYLVATDVAARGIDVRDVTHVINYDLPKFCEDYVHRIGRTGRAGKSGVAISFVLSSDTRNLQRIERYIGQRLKLITNVDIDTTTHENSHKQPSFHDEDDDRPQRPAFRSDGDGHRKQRSSFRSDGDNHRKPRSSFRSDDDDHRKHRPSFRSDGDNHRKQRSSFKNDGDDHRKPRSSFRNDGDDHRKPRSSFRSDGEGHRKSKSSFRSDGEGHRKPRSSFRNDGEGQRKQRSSFRNDGDDSRKHRSSFRSDSDDNRKHRSSFRSDRNDNRRDKSSFKNREDHASGRKQDISFKKSFKKRFENKPKSFEGRQDRSAPFAKDGRRPFKKRPSQRG